MNEPNTVVGGVLSEPPQEQIALLAYFIWMSEGCPEGRHDANWHDAERQLRAPVAVPRTPDTEAK